MNKQNIFVFAQYQLRIVITAFFLLCCGCTGNRDSPVDSEPQDPQISMKLNVSNESVLEGVVIVEVVVTGQDMITIKSSFEVVNGIVVGTIPQVPTGLERHFRLFGYSETGETLVTGEAYADIEIDTPLTLQIEVYRTQIITPEVKLVTMPEGTEREFIKIPAGYFNMGSNEGESNEKPIHRVYLDEYFIGKYEVTMGEMMAFLNGNLGTLTEEYAMTPYPPTNPRWFASFPYPTQYWTSSSGTFKLSENESVEKPARAISYAAALRFCEYIGGRLPTEAEWEKAAGGINKTTFPWGDSLQSDKAAVGLKPTATVYDSTWVWDTHAAVYDIGSFPGDVSPYGIYDMAGNVSEWVKDLYNSGYYYASPETNPQGPQYESLPIKRVGPSNLAVYMADFAVRGGNVYSSLTAARTTFRRGLLGPSFSYPTVGFRCVTD